jgi:uncharacterized membrane protein
MRTPAQIAGHPVHPMLVTLPIGMWIFSLAADVIATRADNPDTWHSAGLYAMVGGIIGALLAAVPGTIDMLSLRDRPIQRTALKHMALNLAVVAIFAINAWMRAHGSISDAASLAMSVVAIALLGASGWLGGKMVYEAGVAVNAGDTVPSAGSWDTSRDSNRARTGSAAGGWTRGDRAMAADADRPSRDSGEDRLR